MSVPEALDTIQDAQDQFYYHYKIKLKLSQKDLANFIGTTPQYIYELLNGTTKGDAARKNLITLFKKTNYDGELWIK